MRSNTISAGYANRTLASFARVIVSFARVIVSFARVIVSFAKIISSYTIGNFRDALLNRNQYHSLFAAIFS
ncbi:hypothetical protein [Candidatus Liberibacter solanacearum]|uniref:hypothetical protein n=1 Tax=Candidatus Liberibacter solanacearum TaxID=556287 RepID=UPI00061FEB86|nr:hypothetical protein [Candidatus Liberibacter solanacearum]KJZ81195.1 hypothetical protein KP07_01490 [Candidatus Liberibacter solanacearum]